MRRCPIVCLVALVCLSPLALAGTVDPPIRVNIKKLDRTELSGQITKFDDKGFEFMNYKKETNTFTWDEFAPDTTTTLHARLIQKGTADEWLELGKKLLTMPGGRDPANAAFGRALRL